MPLPEILGEIRGVGPSLEARRGGLRPPAREARPGVLILEATPAEAIARAGSPLLAEAVSRLRAGTVIREAGYDGEYGVIRLFDAGELDREKGAHLLFDDLSAAPRKRVTLPSLLAGEGRAPLALARGAGEGESLMAAPPSPDLRRRRRPPSPARGGYASAKSL